MTSGISRQSASCRHRCCGGTNDGDGLDADDARALAERLQAEIDAGHTEAYSLRYASSREQLPDEPCETCGGTGTRKPYPKTGAGDPHKDGIVCDGCDGNGYTRPFAANYSFSTDNVQQFVNFLRDSGGFQIH